MRSLLVVAPVVLLGCGPGDPPVPAVLVPANYTATYPIVRGCRSTTEHISSYGAGTPSISNIRVVINPEAMAQYHVRGATLPVGTTIMKEEYGDASCATVIGWTVMRKEPAGYDTAHGDWHWQRVRASDRAVLEDGRVARCTTSSCHAVADCTAYDWTCTQP